MRAWIPLSFCALAASTQAEEVAAAPLVTVALESDATRYGTSYETVYQLNLKPSATLRFDALELSAIVPSSTSATFPTYCCRATLGNATVAAVYRGASDGLRFWSEASVSAPTSYWSDAHASSLAATAALTRDAGYFLPNTTTLRTRLGGELGVTRWLRLGGSAGVDVWLRHDQATSTVVMPLIAYATLPWAQGWSARGVFRTLARAFDPLGPRERFLHELSGVLAHEWSASRVEVSVSLPLDASLRELEMLSLGFSYARSF